VVVDIYLQADGMEIQYATNAGHFLAIDYVRDAGQLVHHYLDAANVKETKHPLNVVYPSAGTSFYTILDRVGESVITANVII
jgi:hypothetical protein